MSTLQLLIAYASMAQQTAELITPRVVLSCIIWQQLERLFRNRSLCMERLNFSMVPDRLEQYSQDIQLIMRT